VLLKDFGQFGVRRRHKNLPLKAKLIAKNAPEIWVRRGGCTSELDPAKQVQRHRQGNYLSHMARANTHGDLTPVVL
jgi:hypothetical protein